MRFVTFAVTALAAMPFGLADPAREGGRKQGGRLNKAKLNELQSNKKTTTNAEINIPELTSELVCDDLGIVTASADAIYDLVKSLDGDCDQTESWVPVREAIYTLEFQLDAFDIIIDQFDLTKCFECRDESKIACCFRSVRAESAPPLTSTFFSPLSSNAKIPSGYTSRHVADHFAPSISTPSRSSPLSRSLRRRLSILTARRLTT